MKAANLYGYENKHDLNKLSKQSKKYVKKFDSMYGNHGIEALEKYGDISDQIQEVALELINK